MKLTKNEAARILEGNVGKESCVGINEALRMGASALHHQHENRWRKLSEEQPTEDGRYWVAHFSPGGKPYITDDWWLNGSFGPSWRITHWKPIEPEDE